MNKTIEQVINEQLDDIKAMAERLYSYNKELAYDALQKAQDAVYQMVAKEDIKRCSKK